jgi:hypothetical protein
LRRYRYRIKLWGEVWVDGGCAPLFYLSDISVTQTVDFVMKAGMIYKGD